MKRTMFIISLLLTYTVLSIGLVPDIFAQDTSITFVSSLEIGAYALDCDGKYIYVGCDAMRVVDYSDPSSPSVIGEFDEDPPDAPSYTVHDIAVQGGYVYTVSFYYPYAFVIFDVSDPTDPNPVALPHLPGSAWHIHIYGNLAFTTGCIDGFSYDLQCFDVSDPANPEMLSNYGDVWDVFSNMCKVGDLVYLIDGGGDACIYILDYSGPSNPVLLGQTCGISEWQLYSVAVKNNYTYILQSDHGFTILLQ